MILEYLEDADAEPSHVLLMFDLAPAELQILDREFAALADESTDYEVKLESLPGFSAVDGCSLVCGVGDSDLGVHRADGERLAFRCVLTPLSWRHVAGLLDPLLADAKGTCFQFLSEHGPVTWIISTERGW